ncbi:MAG: hypothetical protein QXR30_02765 [Candidatus Woesearchaeota archaeon]
MPSTLFRKLVSFVLMGILLIITLFLLSSYLGIKIPYFTEMFKTNLPSLQGITPTQNAIHETSLKLKETLEILSSPEKMLSFESSFFLENKDNKNVKFFSKVINNLNNLLFNSVYALSSQPRLPPRANVFFKNLMYFYEIKNEADLFRVLDFCFDFYEYYYINNGKYPDYCPVNISFSTEFKNFIKNKRIFFNRLSPFIYEKDEELRDYIESILNQIDSYSGCSGTLYNLSNILSFDGYYSLVCPNIDEYQEYKKYFLNSSIVSKFYSSSPCIKFNPLISRFTINLSDYLFDYFNVSSFKVNINNENSYVLRFNTFQYSIWKDTSVFQLPSYLIIYYNNSNPYDFYFKMREELFDSENCSNDPGIFLSSFFDIVVANLSFVKSKPLSFSDIPEKGALVRIIFPQDRLNNLSNSKIFKNIHSEVNLFGDPQYILYYSYFPRGYEKYWVTPVYTSFQSTKTSFMISIALDALPFFISKTSKYIQNSAKLGKVLNSLTTFFKKVSSTVGSILTLPFRYLKSVLRFVSLGKLADFSDDLVSLYIKNSDEFFKKIFSKVDVSDAFSKNLRKIYLSSSTFEEAISKVNKLELPDQMKKLLENQLGAVYSLKRGNSLDFFRYKSNFEILSYSYARGISLNNVDDITKRLNSLVIKSSSGITDAKSIKKIILNSFSDLKKYGDDFLEEISYIYSKNLYDFQVFNNNFVAYFIKENVKLNFLNSLDNLNLDIVKKKRLIDSLDELPGYRSVDEYLEIISDTYKVDKSFLKSILFKYYKELDSIYAGIKFQSELSTLLLSNPKNVEYIKEFFSKIDDIKFKQNLPDLMLYKISSLNKKSNLEKFIDFFKRSDNLDEMYSSIYELNEKQQQLLALIVFSNDIPKEKLSDIVYNIKNNKDLADYLRTITINGNNLRFSESWLEIFDKFDEADINKFRFHGISSSDIESAMNLYRQLDLPEKTIMRYSPNLFTSLKPLLFDDNSIMLLKSLMTTKNKMLKKTFLNSFQRALKSSRIIAQGNYNKEFNYKLELLFNNYCNKNFDYNKFKNEIDRLFSEFIDKQGINLSYCNEKSYDEKKCNESLEKFEKIIKQEYGINDESFTYELFEALYEDFYGLYNSLKNEKDSDKKFLQLYSDFLEISCNIYYELDKDLRTDLRNYLFWMSLGRGSHLWNSLFFGVSQKLTEYLILSQTTLFPIFSIYYDFYNSYVDYSNEKFEKFAPNTLFLHSVAFTDPSTTNLFYKEYPIRSDKYVSLRYDSSKIPYLKEYPFLEEGFALISPCYGLLHVYEDNKNCSLYRGITINEKNQTFNPKDVSGIPINLLIYYFFIKEYYGKEKSYSSSLEESLLKYKSDLFNLTYIINNLTGDVIKSLIDKDKNVLKVISSYFRPVSLFHNCSELLHPHSLYSFYSCVVYDNNIPKNNFISSIYFVLKDNYKAYEFFYNNYLNNKMFENIFNVTYLFLEISNDEMDLLVLFLYLFNKSTDIFLSLEKTSLFPNLIYELSSNYIKNLFSYYYKNYEDKKMINNTISYLIFYYDNLVFDYYISTFEKLKTDDKINIKSMISLIIPVDFYKVSPFLFSDFSLSTLWNISCEFIFYQKDSPFMTSKCNLVDLNNISNTYELVVQYSLKSNRYSTLQYDFKKNIVNLTYENDLFLERMVLLNFYLFYNKQNTGNYLSTLDLTNRKTIKNSVLRSKNKIELSFDIDSNYFTITDYFDFFNSLFESILDEQGIILFKVDVYKDLLDKKNYLDVFRNVYSFSSIESDDDKIRYYKILSFVNEAGIIYVNSSFDSKLVPKCYNPPIDKFYINVTPQNQYFAEFLYFSGACFPSDINEAIKKLNRLDTARSVISTTWFISSIAIFALSLIFTGGASSGFLPLMLNVLSNDLLDIFVDSTTDLFIPLAQDNIVKDYYWPNHPGR